MHTINGIHHPQKPIYSWWSELSEQWTAIHRRYTRIVPDDAAYWYTERTNVGVLAQAAWACGLVALEEYQTTKASITKSEGPYSGRCDLWLANGKQGQFIEAKQRYLYLRSAKMTSIINKCLDDAYNDAKTAKESEGEHGIGLVFFPIYLPVNSMKPEEISNELAALPEKLKETEAEMIAWCFPQETRHLKGRDDKNYFPGLAMVGKSI